MLSCKQSDPAHLLTHKINRYFLRKVGSPSIPRLRNFVFLKSRILEGDVQPIDKFPQRGGVARVPLLLPKVTPPMVPTVTPLLILWFSWKSKATVITLLHC